MKHPMVSQIRSMLRHGLLGIGKFSVLGLLVALIGFIGFKTASSREIVFRIALALPLFGFLRGLRIYEYSVRFSLWKDYLVGKATLAKAFTGISNWKIWIYIIPAAYFFGIVFGFGFYLLEAFQQRFGGFHLIRFFSATYLLWIPACAALLLFAANIFGPKPDEEEELALNVMRILNKSPRISPVEIESPAAIERFVNGATAEKGRDVKPYLWILSYIRPHQAMDVFGSALKNSDASVRHMAVTYLGRIGGENALKLLQEHLVGETDPKIKKLIEKSTA